ncbi:uncharacterized protein LOC103053962 [Python bivittatus]|uniref:Uncharacterized protein LOC103053962 n=1 Tax=Python bivittatus TaxID=176946 RepID=A0A9F5N097_PYTBI|nr:uncharacterized protein LOC103053962 [Python bivittatus]
MQIPFVQHLLRAFAELMAPWTPWDPSSEEEEEEEEAAGPGKERMPGLWSLLLTMGLLEGPRGAQSCVPPPGARNWARGRPAAQSSTYPQWGDVYSLAGSAVDGNRDGDWRHGSCSHTMAEEEPWWSLDLGAPYTIAAVVVKNRQECCSERIKGAQIRVGDCGVQHGKHNPVCGTITNGSAGSLSIVCCDGLQGRYVTVIIPGRAEYLTLCELEVYGSRVGKGCCPGLSTEASWWKDAVVAHLPGRIANPLVHPQETEARMMLVVWGWLLAVTLLAGPAAAQSCRHLLEGTGTKNLAKGQPANQSSIHRHQIIGSADKAVDGDCNGDWYHGSCTHTKYDKDPWWYVDLGDSYKISVVIVGNREDCCGERINQAEIRLGDTLEDHGKSNPLCGIVLNTSPGSVTTIYCNEQQGRYVSVHLVGRQYLSLCEVEVYSVQ